RAPRRTPVPSEPAWREPLTTASPTLLPPDLQTLKAIVTKAFGGAIPANGLEAKLTKRLQEYDQARQQAIPQALNRLKSVPIALPESLELGGIFRYANPMDSPAHWEKQEALCEKARQRLLAGDDLATVAGELSQDGTRTMGGLLAPRFLDPLNPQDLELAQLPTQGISQVMRVANGYWCYRLEARSPGKQSSFAEAPWEARRILFRRALSEMIAAGTTTGL
ncbi:MAG: hypothetical protein WCT30_10175, partial [Desulfurivibrionaceae bacterium]